jgi:hypothetical protein
VKLNIYTYLSLRTVILLLPSCLLLFSCLSAFAQDDERTNVTDKATIRRLATQLGASSYKERREADDALRSFDRRSIEELRKHLHTTDPEILSRLRAIIDYLSTKPIELYFKDRSLHSVVRDAVKCPQDETLQDSHVKGLRQLDAATKGIKSIEGIQELKALSQLQLKGNIITDLSPLSELHHLRYLDIRSNQITNLTPLVAFVEESAEKSNLHFLLTGNPLCEIALTKQIPWLKEQGVRIDFIQDIPLPHEMKMLFSPDNAAHRYPYTPLQLRIRAPSTEWLSAFMEKHGSVRLAIGSLRNGKPIESECISGTTCNYSGNEVKIRPVFRPGNIVPHSPGSYRFDLILCTRKARLHCPPITYTVTVPDDMKEMLREFEESEASAILKHQYGCRLKSGNAEKQLSYAAVERFVRKYPDSYLSKVINTRTQRIWLSDLNGAGWMHDDDREPIARINVLVKGCIDKLAASSLESYTSILEKKMANPKTAKYLKQTQQKVHILKEWIRLTTEAKEHIEEAETSSTLQGKESR